MTDNSSKSASAAEQAELEALRSIILGENGEQVTQLIRSHARQIVSEVVVEALHDRQREDEALTHILTPVVNKSVATSVQQQSDKFVGYFYPIVGRLVRKSVAAFLAEFLAKTNELLENSLTLKSLKWRFKAWRAGVSFAQYVASQTFVYKVEQVLLIHSETGILLNSVSDEQNSASDGELVSAMLTAISDFVADSFSQTTSSDEQNLEVVKTADFSLVVKRGPTFMLVAAVKGNIPQELSILFEETNENIHQTFATDAADFNGDTAPFEATTPLLQACLLSEIKNKNDEGDAKRPYLAIVFLVLIALALGWYAVHAYQHQQRLNYTVKIGELPGIVVNKAEQRGWEMVDVELMRDPLAPDVQQWLQEQHLEPGLINVTEKPYLSLEPAIIKARVVALLKRYPNIVLTSGEEGLVLSGELSQTRYSVLLSELRTIPGVSDIEALSAGISVTVVEGLSNDSPEIINAMMQTAIAKINQTEVQFESGDSQLTKAAEAQLVELALQMNSVVDLSRKLTLNVGLIVMGASDATGASQFNQQLSNQRAQSVRNFLIEQGVDPMYLHAIGLGVVELEASGSGLRKVIFNVIQIESD